MQVLDIDGVVYIVGLGLVGVLLVGVGVVCLLVWVLEVLVVGVYYMEGYLLVLLMEDDLLEVLFVVLLVFGGYIQLVVVDWIGQYCLLGEILDDVVGEVFDKIVKLMGLLYLGGLQLVVLVECGILGKYCFIWLMIDCFGLDFSFFGLKIQVLFVWCDSDQSEQICVDIVCGFEDVVVEILVIKCDCVLDVVGCDVLVVVGGVGVNWCLCVCLDEMVCCCGGCVCFLCLVLCIDNGVMIVFVGVLWLEVGQYILLQVQVILCWDMVMLLVVQDVLVVVLDWLLMQVLGYGFFVLYLVVEFCVFGCYGYCGLYCSVSVLVMVFCFGFLVCFGLVCYYVCYFLCGIFMDKVFIEGFEIDVLIGIYDWEWWICQILCFDLEMGFDNCCLVVSDDIVDIFNYKVVSKCIEQFVCEFDFGLVEILVECIVEIVLCEFNVEWLWLKLSKLGVVCGVCVVGVIIECIVIQYL